jgi:hypothetical protein
MSLKCAKQSVMRKAQQVITHTASKVRNVMNKNRVKSLVLIQLDITDETLKRMEGEELRILYTLLADATSVVIAEIGRRT